MIEIILMEPRRQGNLGAVARVMKNFSFENLVLINPKCKIGATARKVAKHANNILDKTKIKHINYLKKIDYLIGTTSILGTDYNIPRNAIDVEQFAEKMSAVNYNKLKIGILIGREASGLTNEEINQCDAIVTIPVSKKYSALNVSHSAAIILYELFKKIGGNKSNSHINFATGKDKEVMMRYIYKILDKLEFSTPEKKDTQKKVWKRVFGKAMLTKREAFAVMGFFRKLLRE
ncbi:MAG: TrmJ/YjtD family RNA methyltransferase [Nanoarchaeota archaeon]